METTRHRVLNDFPYPVAYPYSLIFGQNDQPSNRRWALCFTQYQLLRLICLPLVGQYLREAVDETAAHSISALNRAIAAIRSPFFSDWIVLVHTLRHHLRKLGIEPLFPGLAAALEVLNQPAERPIGLRDNRRLDPLNAILALRNQTAHGGLPDQTEAAEHVEMYLPVLHQVLEAFDSLGDSLLKVHCGQPEELLTGAALIRTLRGAQPPEARQEELTEDLANAFSESGTIVVGPQGKRAPLYPLFKAVTEREPLFLYDGHYGIQVETRQGLTERSSIYYLGTHASATEHGPACERLKQLLADRRISFFLEKDKTAPWTIADSALDYSHRTMEDLLGTKYFPECYLPIEETEREFGSFLRIPEQDTWPGESTRRRFPNGFVLVGLAGAGKTVFLAHQVERLLSQSERGAIRENPNLVLFLRGNAITLRREGMSLFRDVAERLGIAVEGSSAKTRTSGGFSSFRELLDHLDQRWKQDRVLGRRLILILDALNEAPYAESVIREALEMVGVAACFPWCKIVFSIRQEWLGLWSGKLGAQETSPLEELRPFLHCPIRALGGDETRVGPPVITINPFTETEAEEVYHRYQSASHQAAPYAIPACPTAWSELIPESRGLLTNPLYLHLFMTTFDHRPAERLSNVPSLFQRYVDTTLASRDGLRVSVEAIVAHLLQDLGRASADLSDDDCHEIRREWAKPFRPEEARLHLSPVEALAHEGMIRKRVREEGGGYRFVFQTVTEYLIYRHLADARPPQEEGLAYWLRRANQSKVFAEYAGAFAFLLRDWESRGTLAQSAQLVEAAPPWMQDVLTAFLVERAGVGYVPGHGSPSAEQVAKSLASGGGPQVAVGLLLADDQLSDGRFRLGGRVYSETAAEIFQTLYRKSPENIEIASGLALALITLGRRLLSAGQASEAEQAHRRSAEIFEDVYYRNRKDVAFGAGLGGSLGSLGDLQSELGQTTEAERAYRRSVETYEALFHDSPKYIEVAGGLAMALEKLSALLYDAGRVAEAAPLLRRSIETYEALHRDNPKHVAIAHGLAAALILLGHRLRDAGRAGEAELAFRRSVEIYAALYRDNAENLPISYGLGNALSGLGVLLRATDRAAGAESAYRQSVEIYEAVYRQHPDYLKIADALGGILGSLGVLLEAEGRIAEAEPILRRSVDISEALYRNNPENVRIAGGLGSALINLGVLLSNAGRDAEAEPICRRSVEIYEGLYLSDSESIDIKVHYAGSLFSVGRYTEAQRLLDEVLAVEPAHLYASQLARLIAAQAVGSHSKSRAWKMLAWLMRIGKRTRHTEGGNP